jgi:hypothetical protein
MMEDTHKEEEHKPKPEHKVSNSIDDAVADEVDAWAEENDPA